MKPRILILGSTGMLGQAVFSKFVLSELFNVDFTSRKLGSGVYLDCLVPKTLDNIERFNPDWIINCIGVIKPCIDESDANSVGNAFQVNSLFPEELNNISRKIDSQILRILYIFNL